MAKVIRIGTRDSQLAVWQATLVQSLLKDRGVDAELVYMKSEGDVDTVTPLYALGVTGVFTKTLDAALLNNRIDIAVHSMKDVPTQLAQGIRQAAVLKRASTKDIFLYKSEADLQQLGYAAGQWITPPQPAPSGNFTIATGSVRRIAQWLNRYPSHRIENLRGNVNTRLRKLQEHDWNGAIFAAAGLERIALRPAESVDLDWMLPAPAQGAIMVVCREEDSEAWESCQSFNDEATSLCTSIERDFLKTLLGGCSTPISALAEIRGDVIFFRGNIVSPDGKESASIEQRIQKENSAEWGVRLGKEILQNGAQPIIESIRKTGLSSNQNA
jgi:hydroxymethylbilane synthase